MIATLFYGIEIPEGTAEPFNDQLDAVEIVTLGTAKGTFAFLAVTASIQGVDRNEVRRPNFLTEWGWVDHIRTALRVLGANEHADVSDIRWYMGTYQE